MALDVVSIWNDAYALLGHTTQIASETEQTADARRARRFWENLPRTYIEQFQMPFTRAHEALAMLDVDVPVPWTYAFAFPSKCLQPRYFVDEAGDRQKIKYETLFDQATGVDIIATHELEPILAYTYDRDDYSNWPSLTSEPLKNLLASKLTSSVGKKAADRTALYQLYMQTAHTAQVAARSTENTDSQHQGRYGKAYGGWNMGNR